MSDYIVKVKVEPDDGADGVFWRSGERWSREQGKEVRLLDVCPKLERIWLMEHEDRVTQINRAIADLQKAETL